MKSTKKFETNTGGESGLDIKDYHERILKFLIEEFQQKGFKYISMMPGGFEECHHKAITYGFSLLNHENPTQCYYCNKNNANKNGKQMYN
mmetsp:Transcript_23146/g.22622  ORF Transcript_23146/g.22622 Transcript_23146/m.22622 type:complete len:90 (+) Transcript_23146:214-483(+)